MNIVNNKTLAIANALAVTTAIAYVVCAVLVLLVPDLYLSVMQSWFHGLDLLKISSANITIGSFVTGLITIAAAAWVIGYLFTSVHSWMSKKQ